MTDAAGQLLTASLADYAIPIASEMPSIVAVAPLLQALYAVAEGVVNHQLA
jgi:CO/xanthine dehydrogenase Mo-binding subunit